MFSEYTDEFYDELHGGARRSARAIVPLVLKLVRPRSVVDVGCGTAAWLAVFKEHGVSDVLGIDGAYVNRKRVAIPRQQFLARDIRKPFRVARRFDLVVSLEVAEHLPPECAAAFVESLTRLGPVMLFSAAIPAQRGTQHVNERWPDYWAAQFERRGYVAVDPIRRHVWNDPAVDFWYVQNTLMFVRRRVLGRYPALKRELKETRRAQLSLVHPRLFADMSGKYAATEKACAVYKAEFEKCKAEAEKYQAEADAHRVRAELQVAEAATYREEAGKHRASADRYLAEGEKSRAEAEAERARAEFYVAEATKHEDEAAQYRAKVEHCVAQLESTSAEAEASRAKLELKVADAAKWKEEAAAERAKAECYVVELEKSKAEIEQYRAESARYQALAESFEARADFYTTEADAYRFKADPANMSAVEVLGALPSIVRGTLKRQRRRMLARGRRAFGVEQP